MKTRHFVSTHPSVPIASAIAALLASQSAHSQTTRYWDNNGNVTGFGTAGGTWEDPTVSQWTTSNVGTAIPGASITTLINDPLHFGTDSAGNGLGGGTITVSGTVNAASLRFGSQTTSNVTLSGGTINLGAVTSIHVGAGGTTNHNIASSISGAGTSLTKTGNTLTLSGANSYTGTTIISTGTLILNNLSALGSTSGITIGGASTAALSSSLTGITVTAPITTANTGVTSTISFGRSTAVAGSISLDGAIGGNGNVSFTTPNNNSGGNLQTINLGAAGTYAGTTNLNSGNVNNALTLRNSSGAANVLPTTTVLSFGSGAGNGSGRATTFELNGQNQTLAGLSNAGSVPVDRNQRVNSATAATLTINNATDFTFGGSTLEIGGNTTTTRAQITGAIALTKSGTGTFTLGGTLLNGATAGGNTFTGDTNILGGILVLGETHSIQNSAFDTAGSIAGNSTDGLRTTVTSLTLGGLKGGNDFSTRFTSTTGGYTGLTSLTLNPGTGVTHSYAGDIGDGATGMNLTKTGAGTQVLTGTNTHTGATSVTAGVLAVNGSLANTSGTTVGSGATLQGSGAIGGSVTVQSGGTLAAGNSIESLGVGSLDLQAGSTFDYELQTGLYGGTPAAAGDLTYSTGTLEITAGALLTLTDLSTSTTLALNSKLTLISYFGGWTGTELFTYDSATLNDGDTFTLGANTWLFDYDDSSGGPNFGSDSSGATHFVTMTVVPEPDVAALLGSVGLITLLRRRR